MKNALFLISFLASFLLQAQSKRDFVKLDVSKTRTITDTLIVVNNSTAYVVSFAISSSIVDSTYIAQKGAEIDAQSEKVDFEKKKKAKMKKELAAFEKKRRQLKKGEARKDED